VIVLFLFQKKFVRKHSEVLPAEPDAAGEDLPAASPAKEAEF
jgi:hypothetical protein